MMTHDEIKADILQYLLDEYWYCKDKNGRFNVEMYGGTISVFQGRYPQRRNLELV